jgi:NitT/TauT family transport system permease protein
MIGAAARIEDSRVRGWGLSALGVVLFFGLWEAVTVSFDLNPRYFPGPVGVYDELVRIWDVILSALPNTLHAAITGFLVSLALSIIIAIPLVASDRVLNALMPFIVGINTVPRIAMTPLVIYWVGFVPDAWIDLTLTGLRSIAFGFTDISNELAIANYVMAVWVAFFPMLIAAIDGFRDIGEDTENMLEVYGATTWQEFKYVRFKNGLPFIFDGMKIGFILAMIGAVVGEFVSNTFGIGSMARSAIGRTSIARAFSIVLILGLISSAIVLAIYLIESRVIFWRESSIMGEG